MGNDENILCTVLKHLISEASNKSEKRIFMDARFLLLTVHMSWIHLNEYNQQKNNTSKRLLFPIFMAE